jgi:hypothetical protein
VTIPYIMQFDFFGGRVNQDLGTADVPTRIISISPRSMCALSSCRWPGHSKVA